MEWKKKVDFQNSPNYIFYQRGYQIVRDCKDKDRSICGFSSAVELKSYLIELWKAQEGKCFYTKENMDLTGYPQGNPFAFSVDRIVPELGYVKGNIALCCSIVNRIKQDLSIQQLKDWVGKITWTEKSEGG